MTTIEYPTIAARYRHFADHEAAGTSPSFVVWADAVAGSPNLLARLAPLTHREQQPNLLFAAARRLGAVPGDADSLLATLAQHWQRALEILRTRRTQTNEAARCAVLLPVLAQLEGPLALLEVGASAGLCLHPDRYSYRYRHDDGMTTALDPADGPSRVVIECDAVGDVPVPERIPEIVWRAGLDLNPLDPTDPDVAEWLELLVWPEHDDRRERLRAALRTAADNPIAIAQGDLLEDLPALAAGAPNDATLVVFHSQVLSYVHDEAARRAFARTVASLPGHWISNESTGVFDVALRAGVEPPAPGTRSTVALDGRAVALGDGHGRSVIWLGGL